jgi:hypothetical protein
MDPATQQFFAAQMQLIQNLTAAVQNFQASRISHSHHHQHHPPRETNTRSSGATTLLPAPTQSILWMLIIG